MTFRALQDNLRNLLLSRIAAGELTGVSLAARTGFQQAHISNFLNRKRSLSLDAMDQVLSALGLSVLDLVPHGDIRRKTLGSGNDREFEGVALVLPSVAASERILSSENALDVLKFKKDFLRRLRPDCRNHKCDWTRFALIKADAANARAMYPRFLPGATLLIDRHYSSLKPYRRNEPNMYAVRKGQDCLVRYIALHGDQLSLRPHNQSIPLDFVQIKSDADSATCIIGRICHVGIET